MTIGRESPRSFCRTRNPLSSFGIVTFGVGLSLALDEWLYLIVTDGTNQSYLLPVSFWGGAAAVALAAGYALAAGRLTR